MVETNNIWISFWGVFVFVSEFEDMDIILRSVCFWLWRYGYHHEEYLFFTLKICIIIILRSICFLLWRYGYHPEEYLFLTLKIWISSWGVFVFDSEDIYGYHSEKYLFLTLNSKIWISSWGVFVFYSEGMNIITRCICFWFWRFGYHPEECLFFYSEDLDIILRSICFRKVWISFWGVFVFDFLRRIFLLKFKVFGKQT